MIAKIIFIKSHHNGRIQPGDEFNARIQPFIEGEGFQCFSENSNNNKHFHVGRKDLAEIFQIIRFIHLPNETPEHQYEVLFRKLYSNLIPEGIEMTYIPPQEEVLTSESLPE